MRARSALYAMLSVATLGGAAGDPAAPVTFERPYGHATSRDLPAALAFKVGDLARIDPRNPAKDEASFQTLSLFGREDLIAAKSHAYRPTHCAAATPAADPLAEIERRARETSIVIVNESHERSRGRAFTAVVARRLRPLGYDTLAIETLDNSPATTPDRYRSALFRHPESAYLEDGDGFYSSEATFGRLARKAKAIGYRLLPYEFIDEAQPTSKAESIDKREEGQARTLAAFVAAHPRAKLLVHVGYSHAAEVPQPGGNRWLAARLREKTGIDPLTVSQTTCIGGGATTRLAALPATEPPGTFDLVVDHPRDRFVGGRPDWRRDVGDVPVAIPVALRPRAGWRIVEARLPNEPDAAVPLDRVAIRPRERVVLMLPPGRYRLRAIDVGPARER